MASLISPLAEGLRSALNNLNSTSQLNEDAIIQYTKELSNALVQSDISVPIVAKLRDNLRTELLARLKASRVGNKQIKQLSAHLLAGALTEMLTIEDEVSLLHSERQPNITSKFSSAKNNTSHTKQVSRAERLDQELMSGTTKNPYIVMFVGLQGAGKTTTLAKYGAYYKKKGMRVGVIAADTFRAGAYEQLQMNCNRIGVEMVGDRDLLDPVEICMRGVESLRQKGKNLILIDTSGRHKQSDSLFKEMEDIYTAVKPQHSIYVMDAHLGQSCQTQAEAFKASLPLGGVILTKMDGCAKGGGALSAVVATKSPILFIGLGEGFDDFQKFEASSYVAKLLGIPHADMSTFGISEGSAGRMVKGQGTFSDFRDQMCSPMIMSMLSGMGGLAGGVGEANPMVLFSAIPKITDSLTFKERECIVPVSEERKRLIAQGAGVTVELVSMIVEMQRGMNKMTSSVGKQALKMKRNQTVVIRK